MNPQQNISVGIVSTILKGSIEMKGRYFLITWG